MIPPTAPPNVIVPAVPPVNPSAKAPLIVVEDPEKLILDPAAVPPPFVVSMATPAANVIGPVIVTVPLVAVLVVMLPPRLIPVPE